ncbi:hypothetical protein D4764_0108780 [Takifugu flavidus]|uniref:Uncharacterized protein n=1 Tax=Takifugu flavidus TaxID=433684 RepID=A0A5C6MDG5_9TELE|nr:hypothetical protein D4764_0108780 [Takifugu flavidus]
MVQSWLSVTGHERREGGREGGEKEGEEGREGGRERKEGRKREREEGEEGREGGRERGREGGRERKGEKEGEEAREEGRKREREEGGRERKEGRKREREGGREKGREEGEGGRDGEREGGREGERKEREGGRRGREGRREGEGGRGRERGREEGKEGGRRGREEERKVLQQNNICGVWKGLKTISGFKEQKSQPVGDRGWANDLNLFFNRFDQVPTPPPAQSPLLLPQPLSVPPIDCSSCPPSPSLMTVSSHIPDTSHPGPCPPPPPPPPTNTSLLQPVPHITPGEEGLKKNRARKATGPDGISSRLLKSCTDQLYGIFSHTFNLSLRLGHSCGRRPASSQCRRHRTPRSSTATGRWL